MSEVPVTTLNLQLDTANLPSGVDEVGLTGLDSEGNLLWQFDVAPAEKIGFGGLSDDATDLVIEYRRDRRAVAASLVDIPLGTGSAKLIIQPAITPLSGLLTEMTLDKNDLEIPRDTIVLLKAKGALPEGKTLDLKRTAVWSSSDPSVATVRQGLVKGESFGTATISAKVADLVVSTQITVGAPPVNPPDLLIQNDGTLDLDNGTFNGQTLPGWNPTNKTFVVGKVNFIARNMNVVGEELVLSSSDFVNVGNLNMTPDSPRPTPDSYFYCKSSWQVSEDSLSGYVARGYSPPQSDLSQLGWNGGDLTVLNGAGCSIGASSTIDLTGTSNVVSGPGGRGGSLHVETEGTMSWYGNTKTSGSVGAMGGLSGDVFMRCTGEAQINSLACVGGNAESIGAGGPGGRITVVATQGITLESLSVSGGNGANVNADRAFLRLPGVEPFGSGGDGGCIALFSTEGPINCDLLYAEGGACYNASPDQTTILGSGGEGGTLRAFSPQPMAVRIGSVQGGPGDPQGVFIPGPGGPGGKILLSSILSSNDLRIAGGTGEPPGRAGMAEIGSSSVVVDAGIHSFDTDTGELDGASLLGWDATTNSLTVGTFEVANGATLKLTGANDFRVNAESDVLIGGALDFRGADGADGVNGTNYVNGTSGANGRSGGNVVLFSLADISLTGSINVNGGNGGDGGGYDSNEDENTYSVSGGDGGRGGDAGAIRLDASGNVMAVGGELHTRGGDGGNGGSVRIGFFNAGTVVGGTGGAGGDGDTKGGDGGDGGTVTIDTGNNGHATAGAGGKGGRGLSEGGDGGRGGDTKIGGNNNSGYARAGAGGTAGDSDVIGGDGGDGGIVDIDGTNTAQATGGVGGNGGQGGTQGGHGGHGGSAKVVFNWALIARATGGDGGDGGDGSSQGGSGGDGGDATGTNRIGQTVAGSGGNGGSPGGPDGADGSSG